MNPRAAGSAEHPAPPKPPRIKRRVVLTQLQRWGLPLIFLVPVLAVLGPLGPAHSEVTVGGAQLRLQVAYPSRTRNGVTTTLTATVWNDGATELSGVYVTLPRSYLESYEAFELRPAATTVSAETYRVFVGNVPTGASRVVTALVTPGRYWRRPGSVSAASAAAPQPVTAEFSTFNFP